MANLQMSVAHRYLNNNPSSRTAVCLLSAGYYRIDDNWGVGVQEQYEAETGLLRAAALCHLPGLVELGGLLRRRNTRQ